MTTRHRFRWALIGLLALAIIGASAWRIMTLNSHWPKIVTHTAEPGQILTIHELSVNIVSARYLEGPQIKEALGGYLPFQDLPEDHQGMIIATIQVANNTDQPQRFPLAPLCARSEAWENGLDFSAYKKFPGNSSNILLDKRGIVIGPHTQQQFQAPYSFITNTFRDSDWARIKQRDFSLDLIEYPNTYQLQLPERTA